MTIKSKYNSLTMQTPTEQLQDNINKKIKARNAYVRSWEGKQGIVRGRPVNGNGAIRVTSNYANKDMVKGKSKVKRDSIAVENPAQPIPATSDIIVTDNNRPSALGFSNRINTYGIIANGSAVSTWDGAMTQTPQDNPTPNVVVMMQDRPDIFPLFGYNANAANTHHPRTTAPSKMENKIGSTASTMTTQRFNPVPGMLNSRNQIFPVPDQFCKQLWQRADVGKGGQAFGFMSNDDEPMLNAYGMVMQNPNRSIPVTKLPPIPPSKLGSHGGSDLMIGSQPVLVTQIPGWGGVDKMGTPPYKMEWLGITSFLPPAYRKDLMLQKKAMDEGSTPLNNPGLYKAPRAWVNTPDVWTAGLPMVHPARDYPGGTTGAVMGTGMTRYNETIVGARPPIQSLQDNQNSTSAASAPPPGRKYIDEIHRKGMLYAAPSKISLRGVGNDRYMGDSSSDMRGDFGNVQSFLAYTRNRQQQMAEQADFPGVGHETH